MTIGHFINGQVVINDAGGRGNVANPATGERANTVAFADAALVAEAIGVAEQALPGWAATPPLMRARVFFRFLDLLHRNMDRLAETVSLEHGKVFSDAKGEIQRGLEVVEFATGIPYLLKGDFNENVGRGIDCYSIMQPVGVCAGITPFNFPAMVPMWMFPLALACGNTFILKPSEKVPSAANILAELLKEAGLPDGVFNVVHGDRTVVECLLRDPRINAISFVGSTPIAQSIYRQAAAHGKRCQALGGAKNHLVVMPDANLDQAVNALTGAAFGAAGERCMAISVAVAVSDIADDLVACLADKARSLKVGPWNGSAIEMGPLITAEHRAKVVGYIDAGVAEGATLVVDGRPLSVPGYEKGFFLGGTLFDHVMPGMKIYQEEIFGPVLSVLRVPDLKMALDLVNAHPFGNGTSIFTQDGNAARSYVENCNIGMVGVNVPIPVPVAFHSFGGWKKSAFGDHAAYGMEGVRFYTKRKTVTSRWFAADGTAGQAIFTMPVLR